MKIALVLTTLFISHFVPHFSYADSEPFICKFDHNGTQKTVSVTRNGFGEYSATVQVESRAVETVPSSLIEDDEVFLNRVATDESVTEALGAAKVQKNQVSKFHKVDIGQWSLYIFIGEKGIVGASIVVPNGFGELSAKSCEQ